MSQLPYIPFPAAPLPSEDPKQAEEAYLQARENPASTPVILLLEPGMELFGQPEEQGLISLLTQDILEEYPLIDLQEFLDQRAYDWDLYPECFSLEVDDSLSPTQLFLGFDEEEIPYIVHLPTSNPYECFAYFPSWEFGEGVSLAHLVALSRRWYQRHGAVPAAVGFNTVQFYIPQPQFSSDEELETLCHEMLLLCPQLLETCAMSFGNLKKLVSQSHYWYFFWD